MARVYYKPTEPLSQMERVIIIQPGGVGPTTVYCPAQGDDLAWTETIEDRETAVHLGADLANKHGQTILLETRDSTDWWLSNLVPA